MAESRDDPEVFWVDPQFRGILPLSGFHISRSLAKSLKRNDYEVRIDTAFAETVAACADRTDTWINPTIFDLYDSLHEMGFAHSVEIWSDEQLIGGAYGVALNGAFFGESMFSRRRDASKIALAYLMDRLRAGGFSLLDTQFITPHLQSLGGLEIPRDAYRSLLKRAIQQSADFFCQPLSVSASGVIQRNTQTS
ncbi:leucyl/phenylalanyl-tRNA--protein transferase [Cochlodiniinecator piscidefendens]|uniref:leucyl/phenylalanyl-tRNA--protein transferase n=1 Tax=Cochlodiniinecator piscidefendens TaxID=2715756 RepID=UPI0038B2BE41